MIKNNSTNAKQKERDANCEKTGHATQVKVITLPEKSKGCSTQNIFKSLKDRFSMRYNQKNGEDESSRDS